MQLLMRTLDSIPARWIITVSWMIVLTILLLQPLENPIIPTGVQPAPPSFTRELFFSSAHALIFTFTATLWSWTLHNHFSIKQAIVIAAIGLFIYGIGTELGQSRTPGRAPQRIDLLANAIGAIAGGWFYTILQSRLPLLSLRTN